MNNQNIGAMWDSYLAQLVEEHYAYDEDEEYNRADYEDDMANVAYKELKGE